MCKGKKLCNYIDTFSNLKLKKFLKFLLFWIRLLICALPSDCLPKSNHLWR